MIIESIEQKQFTLDLDKLKTPISSSLQTDNSNVEATYKKSVKTQSSKSNTKSSSSKNNKTLQFNHLYKLQHKGL